MGRLTSLDSRWTSRHRACPTPPAAAPCVRSWAHRFFDRSAYRSDHGRAHYRGGAAGADRSIRHRALRLKRMSIDRRQHRPMLAVLLRFSSVVLFAIMSIGVKYLGGACPVGQIIAVRRAIGAAAIVLIVWRTQSLHLLRTERWQSHVLRSSVGMLAMFSWFLSLNFAPIAEATAVVYAGPIFGTLLAALFLRERMRAHRWLAVALGFSGVVIMTGIRLT